MSDRNGLNEALSKALQYRDAPGEGDEDEVIDAEGKITKKVYVSSVNSSQISLQRKLVEEEEKALLFADLGTFDDVVSTTVSMTERAKYIPIRLTYEERKGLRLVNAAINVSDYTNTVDIAFKNKARRRHVQLQNIVAFLSSVVASNNYNDAQKVLQDRNFSPYEEAIQRHLEVARRYKITNAEKMRSEYGKLIYLMQDAVSPEIDQLLGINIKSPIFTVYDTLAKRKGLALLEDKRLPIATREILPDKTKSRDEIKRMIAQKERAVDQLCKEYRSKDLSVDDIRMCLYSICDNNSFLNSNMLPIQECIVYLKQYFNPNSVEEGFSLAIAADSGVDQEIVDDEVVSAAALSSSRVAQMSNADRAGSGDSSGARLTHSHAMQYQYVLQSLELWSAIVEDMFRLWLLSEEDLLSTATPSDDVDMNAATHTVESSRGVNTHEPYELVNTGQGLQRVQQSPRVYRAMHEILVRTKQKVNETYVDEKATGDNSATAGKRIWVGSSVIHLGDRSVPNALIFIDKYSQVSRILGPLMKTLSNLETACTENEGVDRFVSACGGIEFVKKTILCDFFKHAFDGSGGDNFFDAGSCIDGRLTSAWNWCSQISNKSYFPLFKLTGFLSFDGEFDK